MHVILKCGQRNLPADKVLQYTTFASTLAADDGNLWEIERQGHTKIGKGVLQLIDDGDQRFHPLIARHLPSWPLTPDKAQIDVRPVAYLAKDHNSLEFQG